MYLLYVENFISATTEEVGANWTSWKTETADVVGGVQFVEDLSILDSFFWKDIVFQQSIVWANTRNRLKLEKVLPQKRSGWRTQKYKLNGGSRSLIILLTFYLFFSLSFWSLAKQRKTMKPVEHKSLIITRCYYIIF